MSNREDVIRNLATSFGMGEMNASKFGGSKYDGATGTFYCDGVAIPKSTVNKAKDYFKRQVEYWRGIANASDDNMDMFLISTVAYNSICMLESNVNQK